MTSSQQYLRKCNLVVSQGTTGLDLSALRIKFRVLAMDADRTPAAVITVFNLKDQTASQIQKEFTFVRLQAGYESGNFGIIFQGTIKQVRRGRMDAKDSFVEILASDGDFWRSFGMMNKTVAAGSTIQQRADAIVTAANQMGDAANNLDAGATTIPLKAGTGGTLPRGRVMFGLSSYHLTNIAESGQSSWFVQDGKLNIVTRTGYLPGEIVVLNAQTGMIGVPEATEQGIQFTSLLNPQIRLGRRVQIANKDLKSAINTTTIREQGFPRFSDINFAATVTNDGVYRTLLAEHFGDTRGNEWFTRGTCLAIDASAAPANSVNPS